MMTASADSRRDQIEKAIQSKKHIISEKPVADTIDKEWEVVDLVEKSDIFSTVNLYLRNSWYHQIMKQFIEEGEEIVVFSSDGKYREWHQAKDTSMKVLLTTIAACTT